MELNINTNISFDEATHTYLNRDGIVLTGVTSVMKAMGVAPDYGDIPKAVLDAAAGRGTLVHLAIEDWCAMERAGEIDEERFTFEPDYVKEALAAYKTLPVRAIANEYLVSDNEYIATFIDIVEETDEDGVVDLCDIKYTSGEHREAVAWQLSLGKWLFELQNPHLKVRNLYLIHLKEGARKIQLREVAPSEVRYLIDCFIEGTPYVPQAIVPTEAESRAVEAIARLEGAIVALDAQKKEYEAQRDALREGIMNLMKSHNIKKWRPTENISFTIKDAYTTNSVDSKRLKEEKPDIYNVYVKEKKYKESLLITIKNKKS